MLVDSAGVRKLAFQQVDQLTRTTWPQHDVPMQLHVDFTVSSPAELQRQRERAEALGAEILLDRTDDADEPLYVFADPSGHPFCIFARTVRPRRSRLVGNAPEERSGGGRIATCRRPRPRTRNRRQGRNHSGLA